jgi:hypothetical protein
MIIRFPLTDRGRQRQLTEPAPEGVFDAVPFGLHKLLKETPHGVFEANVMFNSAKQRMTAGATGEIDFIVDTIKAMLVTATFVPDADNVFIDAGGASDAVDARAAGTTDQTLASKAIGVDNTGDFAYIDAADPTWTSVAAGSTIEGVVIYKDTGTTTTSPMICYLDISVVPNGGNITIQFATPATGAIAKAA